MRIATYNVEWFNALFDDDGQMINDDSWSKRYNVTKAQQTAALGAVFQAMDADAIMVIEAPDSHRGRDGVYALEGFAAHFGLRARSGVIGYSNDTQQEIILMYDPDVLQASHAPQASDAAPSFEEEFKLDLDLDSHPDPIVFSKPPLEVSAVKGDFAFNLIGVHAKSKAPHGASNPKEVMQISIQNRRKQLAQCIWLRARVAEHLAAKTPLIVLGDFNDGPGLDEYERLFGRSGVEIVLGEGADDEKLYDPHAQRALSQRLPANFTTSRFFLRHEKRYLSALLDYIMVSSDLKEKNPAWHIWHPFDDPACYGDLNLREALLAASDHFPVTLDIDI